MKILLNCMMLILAIVGTNANADGKKIIKWVDNNGVTQYGDRLPMPSKASKASVLSKQGVKVQEIEQKAPANEQDSVMATQTRRDNALLASYSSTDEIDIARKRNTKIDELALASLQQKLYSLNNQLTENNKFLLEFAKKKKVAPTENVAIVEKLLEDIAKTEQDIIDKEQVIAEINERYAEDKARYNELESRKGKVHDIKYSKKNIAELERWRDDAQSRVEQYEAQIKSYKRAGSQAPSNIVTALLNATKEVERANAELEENQQALMQSKAGLSN